MLKIKNNKQIKKILAVILLIITLFSTVQPVLAVSSSGTGTWTPGQWDSGVFTTDNKTSLGMLIRRLVNTVTGEKITVFCAEHGVDSSTGQVDTATHIKPTDPKMKEASKIAYLGWYSKYGDYIVDGGILAAGMNSRKMDYVFTQQMIWETLGQSNATFKNSGIQSQYESFKNDVNSKMNRLKTKPSFSDTTVTVEVGESTTLTDSNGVLADYSSIDTTQNEIRFTHNKGENTLVISVGANCNIEDLRITDEMMKSWGLIKEETRDHDTTVYFQFREGVQNQLYAMNYNDPVSLSLNLTINLFGSLELSKLNKNGDLIDGAVFNITGPDGYNQNVTVSNGKITIDRLKRGTYTIKEITAPHGYLLDTNSYNVEVKANQKATKSVVNAEPTGTFTLTKYNSDKSAKIQGIKYRIWSDNGYDEIHTTDNNGKIEVTGLKLGKYNYQETETVEGYLIDDRKYSFSLDYADQNTAVVFASAEQTNDEPTGEITIEKTDRLTGNQNRIDKKSHHGDATLSGATYTLYAKSDIYNVARTIKYFSKDEQIATFTFNGLGVASIKITNTSTPAKLSVNGNTLCGLPMGTFYSRETIVPTGYNADTTIYEYTLAYLNDKAAVIKTNGTVINDVETAPFEIIKVSTNTNSTAEVVPDAEFTAILSKYVEFYGSFDEALKHLEDYASDEYSIFKTGSNGHGISGRLAYGEYTVRETYTPSPEINTVEDFYVTIDRDSNTPVRELVENDSPFEAYLLLQKKDKASGKYVTYSNATFSLYKLNEDNGQWERVQCKVKNEYFDTWTTDSNGMARTETKMEAGTYKLDELKIPDGFLQLDEELIFKVNNRNSTLNYDQDWDAWITVTAVNEQPKGRLEVNKTINLRPDADKTLITDIDYTKIAFELVANERIIDYTDGSTIYEEGQTVGTYNLNEEGKLVVDNLWMGSYYLKEVSTIDGAVLDDTKHDVVFTQTDTSTKKYTVKLDIGNDTTFVEFSKTDITGEAELKGAKLSVLDKEGNVIDSWTSSEKSHKIEGLKVGNTYVLREEIAPEGYVKATDIEFKVENTAEIQKVQMIDKIVEMYKKNFNGEELEGAKIQVFDTDNNLIDEWISEKTAHRINGLEEGKTYRLHEEIAIEGYVKATDIEFTVSFDKETQVVEMIDKIVTMAKTDIGGNEIEGAELKVLDKEGNIVDSWTSTKESHNIKGLTEGETYTLVEDYAPEGFVISNSVEFTVSLDKETQIVEMIDKIVEISKTDIEGNEIEGATLVVTSTKTKNIVDQWVSGTEPHKVNGLIEGETYILHEEIVIDGYVKATDIEFTVSLDKETQKLIMVDKIVEVSKTDLTTGEELEGAELKVIDKDGNIVDSWTSTKEAHKVKGLVEGETYKLVEVTAPYGYEITEEIEFTVSLDKETQVVEMKDMPILKNVKVIKIDSATKETIKDNFTFAIYEDPECTKLIKEIKSNNEDGTVLFEELRFGTYYIKEVKAPKDYELSNRVVKVEINDKGIFVDDTQVEEKENTIEFTFENNKIEVPKTGDESNIKLFAGAIVLSLLGIAFMIVRNHKKNKQD